MNSRILFCLGMLGAILRAGDATAPVPRSPSDAVEIAKRSLPFVREKGIEWIENRE
jgi:hypothetical protein